MSRRAERRTYTPAPSHAMDGADPSPPTAKSRATSPAALAAAAVGLVLLALIPLGAGPWTGRVPYLGDVANMFHPLRTFTRAALSRGEMPWWNGHTACGVPHLTDPQSGFWDPLTRLVETFDPGVSISIEIVMRLALAGA